MQLFLQCIYAKIHSWSTVLKPHKIKTLHYLLAGSCPNCIQPLPPLRVKGSISLPIYTIEVHKNNMYIYHIYNATVSLYSPLENKYSKNIISLFYAVRWRIYVHKSYNMSELQSTFHTSSKPK